MEKPILSIIIPAHNTEDYLPGCVESIRRQTGLPFEILLVDDSSTDRTGEICDGFAMEDPRIRAVHVQFRDVSLTRNAGLQLARGEYVGFCDGDDAADPAWFQKLSEVLSEHRPDVIRYGYRQVSGTGREDFLLSDPEGMCSDAMLRRWRLDGICPEGVLDYSVPRMLTVYSHVFRREFLEKNGLRFVSQKEILSEDYLFVLRCLWQAESVYHLPEVLYDYMVHPGSLSRKPKANMMQRKLALIREYLRFLPLEDPEVPLRLRNFYIDSVYDCFVNACTQCASRADAMERIRPLLADPDLHRCLKSARKEIRSAKAKCICFLMAHRMGTAMYECYRIMTRKK